MRISDWSSDVCSSDLSYGGNSNNNRNSTFWLNNGSYLRLGNVQLSYQARGGFWQRMDIENAVFSLIGDNLHVWDTVKIFDPAQEIGRASCRERGCQYV